MGAAEDQLGDLSAPKRIDGEGATRLVGAANAAGVQQFILVTSLGTGKIGWPSGEPPPPPPPRLAPPPRLPGCRRCLDWAPLRGG